MQKRLLPVLYALVLTLSGINCVQDIDFSKGDLSYDELVISGTFSNGLGPHRLRLTHPNRYDKQFYVHVGGAVAVLSDDQNNHWPYREVIPADNTPAYYELTGVNGLTGHAYTLEVRLPNGDIYRTQPQILPEVIPVDTVEVKGQFYTTVNDQGITLREPFGYAYAQARTPMSPNGRYLRWEAEVTYLFNEIDKLHYPPIMPPQLQCFVTNRISDQKVSLADPSKLQPGSVINENVGKRRYDHAFEWRIAYCVYQRTIDQAAYKYWEKVQQLLASTGTIFDAPPAKVTGNLINTTDSNRPALGWFEVAGCDTMRVFTQNGGLGPDFILQDRPYCKYDFSKWPPVNHPECDNCSLIQGATLQPPSWWR